MKVRITPFTPEGVITAPPSKSVAMRYILLAAVADGKTGIENVGDSADVLVAIDCAGSLGAEVDYDGRSVIVYGIKTLPETADFDFGECGFLLRTVIPVANALGVKFSYRTCGNLSLRPVKPLFDALSKSLFKTENGEYYGKATAGEFVIDGSQSSQFISGLLFAAAVDFIDKSFGLACSFYSDYELHKYTPFFRQWDFFAKRASAGNARFGVGYFCTRLYFT